MLNALIQNMALLVALSALYGFIARYRRDGSKRYKLLTGLLFGLMAVAAMMLPFKYSPGIIYDGRSVILTLAGLFGGGLTALTSILIAGAYRAYLGGSGVWAGLATILACTTVGYSFRRFFRKAPVRLSIPQLYLVGLVSHIVMLLCQLLLPAGIRFEILAQIWWPVLLIFPATTLAIAILLQSEDRRVLTLKNFVEAERRFREILEKVHLIAVSLDMQGHITFCNDYLLDLTGWNRDEVLGKDWFNLFLPVDLVDRVRKIFVQSIHSGDIPQSYENEIKTKDGKKQLIFWNNILMRDQDGSVIGTTSLGMDVTEVKELQSQLEQSEQRLLRAEKVSKTGNWEIDLTNIVVTASPGAQKIYGLYGDHFTLNEIQKIPLPEYRPEMDIALKRLIETNSPYNVEFKIRNRETGKILDIHSMAVYDKERKTIFGTIQDITERKLLEEELRKSLQTLQLTYDTTSDILFLLDVEAEGIYRFVSVNKAFLTATGLRENQVIGKTVEEVIPEPSLSLVLSKYREAIETGKTVQWEETTPYPEGVKVGWVSINPSFDENGKCTNIIGSDHDITDRKELEEDLRKLNEELELRVAQRTEQLEHSNREMQEFVYSVSHDLRAPLRAISGFAEIITRKYRDSLNEEGQHYFDNIAEAGQRMGFLISDLLDYARLGKGAVRSIPVDMTKLIRNCLADLEPLRRDMDAEIIIPDEIPNVKGDPTLLMEIMINLLENALKYNRKDVKPVIEIGVKHDNDHVSFFIKDNGIGIAPEHCGKIFHIFQRLSPRDKSSGTGVGLAIVKKAVYLSGGKIDLTSEPGKGSTFVVSLPSTPEIKIT